MVHAFIMVNTAAGKSQGLLDSVRGLGSVEEAHIVAGDYDIVVEVDAEEVYNVLQTSSSDIQGLDGVVDTKTYIAID
ncbi:Lrp/AsnC ligand binding domain-containing protein [Haladaptatus pallidirubidus]|uniref:Lrp/AsnC ligand binding domain-containing protein n=1 Tax=Haladaptatus pallidirubidus TaxID=1008152 RepID=A0AAV3UEL0_9EURY|nr:Lrp/AsnC ligand binding domain-containing protein [Haladaptatus pallidirubidus]